MEVIALLMVGGLIAALAGGGGGADAEDGPDVRGTDRDDTLSGTQDDLLSAGAGNDMITLRDDAIGHGGAGRDRIEVFDRAEGRGGEDGDFFDAWNNSRAYGGEGRDVLTGRDNSQVHGGRDGDRVLTFEDAAGWGDAGDDSVFATETSTAYGGDGNDTLTANGDASVHGDAGNDVLSGYQLAGHLDGGDGDDTLTAVGHASLTGGAGADRFQVNLGDYPFGATTPETVITDFETGIDRLLVTGSLVSDLQITRDGADTLITVTNHNSLEPSNPGYDRTIRLVGVDGLTTGDLAMSDPLFETALTPEVGSDGDDTVTLGADPAFLLTQAGRDLVTLRDGGTHEVATFDGNDTVTGEGAGLVRTGEGDDVITLDNGAAGAVTVYGGGGEDVISVDATDGSLIVLEDEPYGQGAVDDLTLFVDADNIGDGPSTIINVNPSSSDTIEIRIDAALTGPVTWVDYVADLQTSFTDYVGIQVGGVEVARIPGSAGEWQNAANLTIIRGVVF